MALHQFHAFFTMSPFIKDVSFALKSPNPVSRRVKVKGTARMSDHTITVRRSANYQPPIWKHEFIQSLTSEFTGEKYTRRFNELKKEVGAIMNQTIDNPLKQLELIDTLQRLGISYHFENQIKDMLERIYNQSYMNDDWKKNDLYAVALEFRLLRQHRFKISEDVFNHFQDKMGNFNSCLCENINGLLSLYEASFLSMEGENTLKVAKCFAITYLEKYVISSSRDDDELDATIVRHAFLLDELDATIVRHALELPLHWRMLRLEARWFIDIYERKANMNPILLEIAKLDFNIVQSIHQEDLKYVSSWWMNIQIGEELRFARDRLMENFFWTIGVRFEPKCEYVRRMGTKINALVTLIDDVYDVYGTLDELQLFTDAVERWDLAAMNQLPHYMKLCFLTLHNSVNEMAFEALRDKGVNVIKYLKKVWVDLCKAYMREAKWYHGGYKPNLQEYMDNAWISISGPVILVHGYVFVTCPIIMEDLESLVEYADIIRWSSTILRLVNDLGTSSDELKRGDVPKSIQCYMKDNEVMENHARDYIRHLIDDTWKKLNKVEVENSVFSQVFIEMAKNLGRMAQCMYQHGDGHGHDIEHQETKDRVVSLLTRPIPIQH